MASDNSTNRPTMQGQRCGNCAVGRQIEAPAWMATKESIDRESALYSQERRDALLARTGGLVTGAKDGTWIDDRSTGVVFLRSDGTHRVGEVIRLECHAASQGGELSKAVIYFRVLRVADIAEVRAMAAKRGGEIPPLVRPGNWYQVLTD